MGAPDGDKVFSGSVPQLYEELMVPMLFAPYAQDLALRAQRRTSSAGSALLEIAAGTGVVTRALADQLPASASIVATDLNQPMLDQAARIGTSRPVTWRQANAMQLPFPDASFDAVLCQFGVMFFPDRPRAYAEARRVLRPGGAFLFSTWDRIELSEITDTVQRAVIDLYPRDPPRFMARTPHGYFDPQIIAGDLERAGFGAAAIITPLSAPSRALSARHAARAICQGTPMRAEIEAQGPGELDRATAAAEDAVVRRFGRGAVEGQMSALILEITR
jgi:SAM-dependent methyltransferase